jgi:hypothetical protein
MTPRFPDSPVCDWPPPARPRSRSAWNPWALRLLAAESFGRVAARRALGLDPSDVVPAPAQVVRRASA